MSKRGRKSAWDSILERFDDIEKALKTGATERSVAKSIGIGYTTWNKYKAEKTEFADLIKRCRKSCVMALETSLFDSAIGGKVSLIKSAKVNHVEYENGKRVSSDERIVSYPTEEYIKPDTVAAIFLLTNWDPKQYARDPHRAKLAREEFNHKKKMDELNTF